MASVRSIGRSNQYHHHSPAAEMPRTQSGREPLAIYARKLALKPRLQILRRYRRSLLLRLEYAPRSPMEDHVHRTMPVGTSVLINKTWYKGPPRLFAEGFFLPPPGRRARTSYQRP